MQTSGNSITLRCVPAKEPGRISGGEMVTPPAQSVTMDNKASAIWSCDAFWTNIQEGDCSTSAPWLKGDGWERVNLRIPITHSQVSLHSLFERCHDLKAFVFIKPHNFMIWSLQIATLPNTLRGQVRIPHSFLLRKSLPQQDTKSRRHHWQDTWYNTAWLPS